MVDDPPNTLVIRGAREHNLKDVSLDLPRDSLIVFTGLSGSGKSSLARPIRESTRKVQERVATACE